jgi:hypothetical protein
LVIFIDLGEDYFWCYDCSAWVVNKMVVPFLVPHFELGHISAGSVESFLITGDLGNGQVGLIIPGIGGFILI